MNIVSDQVKILLERMDMHPEEFVKPFTRAVMPRDKWDSILNYGTFNLVERALIKAKYKKLKRESTQKDIMTSILYDDEMEIKSEAPQAFSTVARMNFSNQERIKQIVEAYKAHEEYEAKS